MNGPYGHDGPAGGGYGGGGYGPGGYGHGHGRGPYHDDQGAFSSDVKRALNVVLFAFRAVKRRKKIALLVFVTTMIAAGGALTVMPKMYRVTTRILTHRAYVLPALVSPRRSIPLAADAPTKGTVELIKSRKLLEGVIQEAAIKETWDETRDPVGRLKDSIRETIFGEMPDADFHEALLEMLDKRVIAYIDDEVVVTQIEWHQPEVALAISKAVQAQFLRQKKDGELSEVRETLHILEANLESAHRTMEAAAEEFQRVVNSKAGVKSGGTPVKMRTIRVRKPDDDRSERGDATKVAQLERDLADVRQLLRVEEGRYEKRLDEANAALSGLRQTLGPEHPDVQNATRVVEERSRPSPELMNLRASAAEIERQLRRYEGGPARTGGDSYETVEVPETAVEERGGRVETTDPDIERALSSLEQRIARYNDFVLRLEDARTELATADAAFDHRYFVTTPPLYPKKHVKPKVPVVLGGGFFAALLLAFAFALGVDLASRRVIEPWQIERITGVPVLGSISVKRPLLTGGDEKKSA